MLTGFIKDNGQEALRVTEESKKDADLGNGVIRAA